MTAKSTAPAKPASPASGTYTIAPRCAHKGCRRNAMSLGHDRYIQHCEQHATRDEKLTYFAAWGLKW